MKYTRYIGIALAACLLWACHKEELRSSNGVNPFGSTNSVEASGTASLGLESEVSTTLEIEDLSSKPKEESRAYEGLKIVNEKLRPKLDSKVKVLVVLGSSKHPTVHIEEMSWLYDSTTDKLLSASSISGSGSTRQTTALSLNAPEALLKAGGLRMMLIMNAEGTYTPANKTINLSTDTRGVRMASSKNGVIDLKIPYFAPWADVVYDGQQIKLVDGQKLRFEPQGRVIKINLTNKQSVYSDLKLRGIAIQTNILSFFGKYDLSQLNQAAVQNKTLPQWVPADATTPTRLDTSKHYTRKIERRNEGDPSLIDQVMQGNYFIDLAEDIDLPKWGQSADYYAWCVPLSQPYELVRSTGTSERQVASTRFYIRAIRRGQEANSEVKGTYAFMPAYHSSKSTFSKRGVRVNLLIDDSMVRLPMELFAQTRIVSAFSNYGNTENPTRPNDKWAMKMTMPNSEYLSQNLTMRFSWRQLYDNGYFTTDGKEQNGYKWNIPFDFDMRALIPIDIPELDNVFKASAADGTERNDITETEVLQKKETYKSSFYRMPYVNRSSFWQGNIEIAAVRFMKSGDDSSKTAFVYTLAARKDRERDNSTQYHYRVKAYHLGKAFPEIKTAKDFYRYKSEIVDNPLYWWRENERYLHGVYTHKGMIRLHLNGNATFKDLIANDDKAPYTVLTKDNKEGFGSGYHNTNFGVHMFRRQ